MSKNDHNSKNERKQKYHKNVVDFACILTFSKIWFFQYWFSLRFANQYFLKTSTCLEKITWRFACIFQVDHKSSLEWFLPRVIWIYSQTSFRCITQWWKSSSWAHPLEQCTWCILSSKPHMTPTMTRSGKVKKTGIQSEKIFRQINLYWRL